MNMDTRRFESGGDSPVLVSQLSANLYLSLDLSWAVSKKGMINRLHFS